VRRSTLALLGGLVAAIVLAAVLKQRDDAARPQRAAVQPGVASPDLPPIQSAPGAAAAATRAAPAPLPTGARAGEAELRERAGEDSYARVDDVLIEHLVSRGLARPDGERVVRRFLDENVGCLFDALRVEAGAQAVAYDSVLDALEADLYDSDGPWLAALVDMRAAQARAAPCALAAAEQAGIEPAAFSETTRAAIIRRAR